MKFNKDNKCIEITKSEYDDIKFIISISTCFKNSVEKTMEYLKTNNKDKAYNLVMAVENDYKYMKIVE